MGPLRIVAASILAAASLAAPIFAAPVTRGQLEAMGRQKVDPAVMRAIVERDCVDFDVDAANASELSKLLPAGVLEAAIECRKRAASTGPGAAAPADAAAPAATPAPAPTAAAPADAAAPAATPAPAPTAAASVPAANAPVASVERSASSPGVPGEAQVRVRAVFIAESGALRCSCSLDGRPIAMLTKEAQGEFGQAVERSKVRRESGFVSTGAGRHVVAFVCDPGVQAVRADVDLVAGERRTIEIAESALRHWKLRKIDKN